MSQAKYDWCQISSGPRLAVATMPHAECASFAIHVPAGSRDESNLPAGLAHFVEHMVFKGTKHRSARDLTFEIENVGGQVNACTTEDQTTYEGRADADQLATLASVICDMVWHSTFPEAEIKLEREVIREEITLYRESPSDHIGDLISKALWGDHPLGSPISGSAASISRIGRKHLLEFSAQHHFRNDMVIAAAGPLGIDELQALINPLLPQKFHEGTQALPFEKSPSTTNIVDESRETDQLQLALAWHTPGRQSPKRHALRLLSLMLGESASSRLFLELREKRGLCYQIASDVTLMHDTGAFEIHAGLAPDGRNAALDCIHAEIADLVTHGPASDELERAKRLAISQNKQAMESTAAHATWAGECLLEFGRIPHPLEWRDQVLAVTHDEIQSIATEIFSGQTPAMAEIRPLDS
ncbi:MAG: hypothetical protein RLZ22_459 [Verrucomicrobiota bacterium]